MDWPNSWAPIAVSDQLRESIGGLAVTDYRSTKVIMSPTKLDDGTIGRVLRAADGAVQVETWSDDGWRRGGAEFADFVLSRAATDTELQEAGLLAADLLP